MNDNSKKGKKKCFSIESDDRNYVMYTYEALR